MRDTAFSALFRAILTLQHNINIEREGQHNIATLRGA